MMPRATWGVLRWIATHLTVALLVALAVVAYWGWHRPPQVVQVAGPIQQVPVSETRTIIEQLPGTVIRVPEIVTAPTATVRVVTTNPVEVTPAEKFQAIASSPEVIRINIQRICVHPEGEAPDPTCGKPLSPEVDVVRSGGGAAVVQTHDESVNTKIGPVETTLHVAPPSSPWTYRAGIAASPQGVGPAGQVQYTRGPFFVQGTLVYNVNGLWGSRGLDSLLMVGVQW